MIIYGKDPNLDQQWATENPLDGSIIACILSPLHTHNPLRANVRDCFHPGIFSSDIMWINNNQWMNPDQYCVTMRVIQRVRSFDACDLNTIIYQDCALAKTYGLRTYAIMLPSSGFTIAHSCLLSRQVGYLFHVFLLHLQNLAAIIQLDLAATFSHVGDAIGSQHAGASEATLVHQPDALGWHPFLLRLQLCIRLSLEQKTFTSL